MSKEKITLIAVGDIILHGDDPGFMFDYVRDVLRSGDITFANCDQVYSDKGYRQPFNTGRSDPDKSIAALIDAGLDVEQLKGKVGKLHLTHYDLGATKVTKKGMGGTQAVVSVDEDHHSHHHHTLHHIEEILQKSDLHKPIKQRDVETFTRLADAEAKVHRSTIYSTLPPPRKRVLVFRPISPCPETHCPSIYRRAL